MVVYMNTCVGVIIVLFWLYKVACPFTTICLVHVGLLNFVALLSNLLLFYLFETSNERAAF